MNEKVKNKILPAVFLLFIFSMILSFILLPKRSYSESEKRVLADFPKFTANSLENGEYTDGIEKYLSDHFPFREKFIGINAYFTLALGQNGKNGVYCAGDGYLITEPSKYDESRMLKNAGYIEQFIEKTELTSYVIIIPETGYTLAEKMPKNHKKYNDDEIFNCV